MNIPLPWSNAAAAAERLLQEHQLSEAELEVQTEVEEPMCEDATPVHTFQGRNVIGWQSSLLANLGRAYNVSGYYSWTYKDGKQVSCYKAVGRPSDVATMRYQFAWFVTEITRLRHLLGKGQGKTWGNSFYLGAAHAIGEALGKTRREVRAQATGSALMVLDNRMEKASALKKALHPDLVSRSSSSPTNFDPGGYHAGKRAGAGLSPKQALSGGSVPLLGGRKG